MHGMRLPDVIRAAKSQVEIGKWNSGPVPRAQFPLQAKPSSFKIGLSWDWLVIKFSVGALKFRVLVLLNEGKQIYRAILAQEATAEYRMICVREFHMKEPGWHCHFVETVADSPRGWARKGMRRIPRGARIDAEFDVTKTKAVQIALKFYGIESKGELGL